MNGRAINIFRRGMGWIQQFFSPINDVVLVVIKHKNVYIRMIRFECTLGRARVAPLLPPVEDQDGDNQQCRCGDQCPEGREPQDRGILQANPDGQETQAPCHGDAQHYGRVWCC